MINRNYDFRWMDMLDFICNSSVDLFGTRREWKIQNENVYLQRDSISHHESTRQESQRLRPLVHEGLLVVSSLMSHMIMVYKFKKLLRDNTGQLDYGYMCIWTEC